jgi:hypothetical protein
MKSALYLSGYKDQQTTQQEKNRRIDEQEIAKQE